MSRSRSYQKKRKKSNQKFILAIILILGLSFLFHIVTTNNMEEELILIEKEINSNTKKITDINAEITDIEEDFKIRNTDQFKEKIAKERLGMVKEDEENESDESND